VLTTPFTELLGCRLPLQQAPMGGVTTPELAAAGAEDAVLTELAEGAERLLRRWG
jgi:nitronate monooxygenase